MNVIFRYHNDDRLLPDYAEDMSATLVKRVRRPDRQNSKSGNEIWQFGINHPAKEGHWLTPTLVAKNVWHLIDVDFQLACPMWPVQPWRLQQPLHDLGGKLRVRVIGRRPEEDLWDTVRPFTSKPASFWTTSFRCRVATTLVVHPTLNTPQSGFTLLKVRESPINQIGIKRAR